ncbi:hypothetical protein QA635_34910 [Bradyrhizobium brasilense]|uniref:hypothetical protein n=1 Tax=Bradyrhizobium brasilense TaxID=1419277 RepID=UPI0024B09120|nr:hypothetical protein [Bradyrhizobium australafricanum]WFU31645.1 hypothetical protein QA635_34910 [Bradyrhizobium australafricanum]
MARKGELSAAFIRDGRLALQLHFSFEVSGPCVGLVSSPPERPCENTVDRDAPLSELDSDATEFLDRPATPRTIEDARIEAVVVRTLETKPPNATHWSSRSMARASGLSVSTVQRIWRTFGLQPHRLETFKLSNNLDFVATVRDVVGLYVAPPERAIVLCVDEKPQI